MADVPYARWYDEGTAAFVKGSTTVTGTNTFWISAGIKAGDIFIDPTGKIYEIASVDSSTQITLRKTYAGETGTGKSYSIIRTYTSSVTAELASKMSSLLNEFERRYDLDMQTITGKSAYDIAKDKGFSGTQEEWLTSLSAYGVAIKNGYEGTQHEWLESLKADNEWSTLDARTQILTTDTMGYRNSIYRGKYLGDAVTDEQYAAIQNKTYEDMHLGDSWTMGQNRYYIAEFVNNDYTTSEWGTGGKGMIIATSSLGLYPMNDTDSLEGGIVNTTMFNETIPMLVETVIDPDFRGLVKTHKEFCDIGSSPTYLGSWGSVRDIKASLLTFEMIFGYLYPYYDSNIRSAHKYRLPLFNHWFASGVLIGPRGQSGKKIWTGSRLNANRWLAVDQSFSYTECSYYKATALENVCLWFFV